MIVIGADTHKRSHALAVVDAGTGRLRGQREIKAEEAGHRAALRRARGLDDERVWAIEDCRHVPRQLDRIERRLRRLPACARVRVAREQVAQIRRLTRQANALERELLTLINAQRPRLLAETGCGALTAAILIGRTAGAERFRSDAGFARQTGTAPIPCSSGQRDRHRLDRGGDRQLNHALHVIAITRARHDPATQAYLARKEAEGKGQKGALRCLKRHLARRFHYLLSLPAAPPKPNRGTTDQTPVHPSKRDPSDLDASILGSAPTPMICLT